MPVGDRRSVSRASRDGMRWGIHVGRAQRHERWFRAPARCRSETGAPFRAPAGMGCGGECTLVGRSVMSAGLPVGDRRSFRCASRDGTWWGMHVGRAPRHEGWFRAPARCRSETGAPFARQPGWDVVRNSRWQGAASSARVSRSRAMPTGGRRSLACGAALPGGGSAQLHFHSKRWCDTHGGRASRHWRWFRAPARADRRSAFPGLRAAPPGGVRRNCIFTARGGVALTGAGRSVIGAGFALPRDAGLKTGAPPLAADPRPARGGVSTAGQ